VQHVGERLRVLAIGVERIHRLVFHPVEVSTGREALSRPAQDHETHFVGIVRQEVEYLGQRRDHLGIERIVALGPIQRDDGGLAGRDLEQDRGFV